MKRYDLMNQINARGTFLVSKVCLPHLLKSDNPHILNLSPPLDMDPKWFGFMACTSKAGMNICVLGMAEFKDEGGAVNISKTAIATAAIKNALGDEVMNISDFPEIMGDAVRNPDKKLKRFTEISLMIICLRERCNRFFKICRCPF